MPPSKLRDPLQTATLGAAILTLGACADAPAADMLDPSPPGPPRAVIFFLGDGMGIATMTAARIYAVGEDGVLTLDTLPEVGFVHTYSNDSMVTDSAPSMSAYMTGVKMNNDVLSMSAETVARIDGCTPDNGKPVSTLLELAKARGWATGVVSTARLTHATPGATYAHICHRDLENEIAAQSVPGGSAYNVALGDGIDVLLGGGRRHYLPMSASGSKRTGSRNLIQEMKPNGYQYVSDVAWLPHAGQPPRVGNA